MQGVGIRGWVALMLLSAFSVGCFADHRLCKERMGRTCYEPVDKVELGGRWSYRASTLPEPVDVRLVFDESFLTVVDERAARDEPGFYVVGFPIEAHIAAEGDPVCTPWDVISCAIPRTEWWERSLAEVRWETSPTPDPVRLGLPEGSSPLELPEPERVDPIRTGVRDGDGVLVSFEVPADYIDPEARLHRVAHRFSKRR